MKTPLHYFAYGSNMSRRRIESRLGSVTMVNRGLLVDYRHRFNKLGGDGTSKGNIEPAPGSHVHGVIYRINAEQLAVLDQIEGGYERISVEVMAANGRGIGCASYRGVRLAHLLEPSRDYLSHYVDGALEHEIPTAYLRSIMPAWFGGM